MGSTGRDEPSFVQHAMTMDDKAEWAAAMVEEMKSLSSNNVFDVVQRPAGRNIVSCRWVFALKRNSNGEVIRHKARLVAKGYSQVQGIDYSDVFAPVVRWDTIRFLLAYAAKWDMELKQFDVKTAFLYGTLDEDIYMEISILSTDVITELMKERDDHDVSLRSLCPARLSRHDQYID